MHEQFWMSRDQTVGHGAQMELRAALAWKLIECGSIFTGTRGQDDSGGHAAMELLPPEQCVDRALAIVDVFIQRITARGELRAFTESDVERAFRRGGELLRIRHDAEYPRTKQLQDALDSQGL